MNKLITRRLKAILVFVIIVSSTSFAQLDNVDFLKSGGTDGGKIIQAYLSPYVNAFGAGLSGGWYNTAKPHKFGGFDITSSFSVGIVPTSAQTFDVGKLGLTTLNGSGLSPTVAGADKNGPTLTSKTLVLGNPVASFTLPKGTNWRYIPAPALQIGLGLPLGTEVKVRYLPKINIGDKGDVKLWGVGLMHSIMQYLPGHKLSPFDVSVFGGYTKLEANLKLPMDPDPSVPMATGYTWPTNAFLDQNLKLTVAAYNVSAIASVNLKVITFYCGLGYNKTSTEIKITGNFPMPSADPALPATPTGIRYNSTSLLKGSDIKIPAFNTNPNLRANIGFRLKLAIVTIHADYTRAMYNVLSAGLGFSFR
jgi:hypothetical protein